MLDNSKWILYWRISTTSTLARRNFFALGLPPPQTATYETYSQLIPQSQGGQAREGYQNIRLLWDTLTRFQAFTINTMVDTVLAAGTPLYLTADFSDGTYLENWFVDVHGVPHPLVLEPAQNSRGEIYQNVELFLNAVVVDNNPATGL